MNRSARPPFAAPRDFEDAAARIATAAAPEALFGPLAGRPEAQRAGLKEAYRRLAFLVHADRNGGSAAATRAFQRLGRLYDAARRRVKQGTYGTAMPDVVLRHGDVAYALGEVEARGDVADLYRATEVRERAPASGAHASDPVFVKVARSPTDNDLLANEAWALRTLLDRVHTGDGRLARLAAHVPTLRASFDVADDAGVVRRANVLSREPGWVSLADVKRAYPDGVHPADMAWMLNRLLAALAVSHACGFVHGAVVPAHVLVRPSDHHGRLVDWCYAVPLKPRGIAGRRLAAEAVRAVSPGARAFYAPEVLDRRPPSPATDLYQAALTMLWLVGGDVATQTVPHVDARLQAFFRSCLLANPARRPQDAWALYDEFAALLRDLYGPPRFRPFSMPAAA